MTILAARRYSEGKPLADGLSPENFARPAQGEFDWIGLFEPTAEEMAPLKERYDLHPLAVDDALHASNSAKAEAYGAQLFVIARTAALERGESIAYGQTAIFLGENFIITVRQGSLRAHAELRRHLELQPQRLAEGPDAVLHALLDFIVDGYAPLLDGLEASVIEMEDGAIASFPDQARIRRIFRLRRTLRRFGAVAGQMEEVASKLANVEQPAVDARARPYFRDVYDHARRAVTRASGLSDTLASIVEIAGLLEQSRQGAITRQLAAWAAILAVPTAIAGIYGMNFDFMPELRWRYGYLAIMSAIAAICGLLFLRFRKIGWL